MKQTTKKITVHVTGYESTNNGAISGWDWYADIANADTQFKVYQELKEVILYRGAVEVEVPEDMDILSEDGIPYVNGEVENFLMENDWENAFKK